MKKLEETKLFLLRASMTPQRSVSSTDWQEQTATNLWIFSKKLWKVL